MVGTACPPGGSPNPAEPSLVASGSSLPSSSTSGSEDKRSADELESPRKRRLFAEKRSRLQQTRRPLPSAPRMTAKELPKIPAKPAWLLLPPGPGSNSTLAHKAKAPEPAETASLQDAETKLFQALASFETTPTSTRGSRTVVADEPEESTTPKGDPFRGAGPTNLFGTRPPIEEAAPGGDDLVTRYARAIASGAATGGRSSDREEPQVAVEDLFDPPFERRPPAPPAPEGASLVGLYGKTAKELRELVVDLVRQLKNARRTIETRDIGHRELYEELDRSTAKVARLADTNWMLAGEVSRLRTELARLEDRHLPLGLR